MVAWILPARLSVCLLFAVNIAGQRNTETPGPTPTTLQPTPGAITASPTEGGSWLSEAPVAVANRNTSAPTEEQTLSPTPAPTLLQTSAPTSPPTIAPTTGPTPPPTYSYDSYCAQPYKWSNESDVPCVDLVTEQDKQSGVGAYYDEEGCGPEASNTSVVGCAFAGVGNCRVCVFDRGLYSAIVDGGEEAPFVDCPCCVPDTYEIGGDIDCDFAYSPAPLPASGPTPPPTEVPTPSQTMAPGATAAPLGVNETVSSPAPTVVPIPMEPCEIGAGGDTTANATLCVDIASSLDLENGIGTYYESGCEGLGCNIAGNLDCRQCVFDSETYTVPEGEDSLVDCPCCVPVTYKLKPESSECVWPITPAPTPAPTTYEEFLARNGGGSVLHPGTATAAGTAALTTGVGVVIAWLGGEIVRSLS